jgi:hypothetical protein
LIDAIIIHVPEIFTMRFISLLIILATFCNPGLSGGISDCNPDNSDDSLLVIEKVYLQTDRTSYFPGDDIWIKAHLVNAFERSLSDLNRNLHIELISPSKEIISGKVIKIDGGLATDDFRVVANLSSGKYRLRAYTNYMRNFSDQIFFNKEIRVIKPSAFTEKAADVGENERNKIELYFFPEGGSPVDNVSSIISFKAVDNRARGCDVTGQAGI